MKKFKVGDFQQFGEERFTKVPIVKNKHSHAFLLHFLPGQEMKTHTHPGRELYLCVLEGSGMFSVDGEELSVTKGDVLYLSPDEKIGFINKGEHRVSIFGTMTKVEGE